MLSDTASAKRMAYRSLNFAPGITPKEEICDGRKRRKALNLEFLSLYGDGNDQCQNNLEFFILFFSSLVIFMLDSSDREIVRRFLAVNCKVNRRRLSQICGSPDHQRWCNNAVFFPSHRKQTKRQFTASLGGAPLVDALRPRALSRRMHNNNRTMWPYGPHYDRWIREKSASINESHAEGAVECLHSSTLRIKGTTFVHSTNSEISRRRFNWARKRTWGRDGMEVEMTKRNCSQRKDKAWKRDPSTCETTWCGFQTKVWSFKIFLFL